jgi:Tol biopolymer transport system component
MALVTATESRTESRDIYVPESIRGMVHRSYLSPDGAWVLVTEMDNGGMLPCRVVPFDGRSAGRIVGPSSGQCTHAAWTSDGRVMYFTSNATGSFQIWRQRFPDGRPEQLTFGPTEAEGLAMSPDARSAVTSIGFDQGAVGISESGTERQASTEGSALLPAWGDGFPTSVFSPDGKKLYYLVQTDVSRGFGSGELWVSDLATGSHERLLPGISITSYDISADGQRVVFSSFDADGTSHIWLARLDRRTPPAKLPPVEARGPVFGPENDVYFRGLEGKLWYLYEIKLDSGQIRKFTAEQAVNSPAISPDGQWILSLVPIAGQDTTTVVKAFPTKGGAPLSVCTSCSLKWTRDQKHLFFSFGFSNGDQDGTTFVIALSPGKALPGLPSAGLASEAQVRKLPIVRAINRKGLFPGPTASVYAFQHRSVQRNLYRLAIPQ